MGDRPALENEFIIMAQCARGLNEEGAAHKLKQILEIFARHNPVNMSNLIGEEESRCLARGATIDEILSKTTNRDAIHAVFINKEVTKQVLKEIKKADIGISVIASGVFDEIFKLADDVGITAPRTVNLSLGIIGNVDRLPPETILKILTQCGHGLVSRQLVEQQIELVRTNKKTAQQAAAILARNCVCGAFNPVRAANLIDKYIAIRNTET